MSASNSSPGSAAEGSSGGGARSAGSAGTGSPLRRSAGAGSAFRGSALRGRVWKFGHDVDTDVMAPWGVIARPFEERRSQVLAIRPEFAGEVRPGDVVVAGRNWGCGSSREQASENVQLLGVSVVLAESFGRIYFRNAIARAFPNVVCPGVWESTEDGDDVEVDLATAIVTNHSRGLVMAGRPYTEEMLAIVQAGGLLAVLRQRVQEGRLPRIRPVQP